MTRSTENLRPYFDQSTPGGAVISTTAHERMHADCDTIIHWDDTRLIGQHVLGHWPHQGISVWAERADERPDLNPDAWERMLRYGFQSRTTDFLSPIFSEQHGAGILMPMWVLLDQTRSEALINSLGLTLELLLAGPAALPETGDSLPEDVQLTARNSHFPHPSAPAFMNNDALIQICAHYGVRNLPANQGFLEFLLDDLPVRAHVHPTRPCLLFDFFLMDVCALQGSLRESLLHTLLTLNQNSAKFASMSLGLDNRHFIEATAYATTDELHSDFPSLMERWMELAREIRALCKTLVLDGVTMEFDVVPLPEGEIE